MWAIRSAFVALLILVVIAFAYNNFGADQVVNVHLQPLFPDRIDVPLVTVVFWAFVSGVVLSLLLFITTYIKLSLQIHTMKKRIRALENEVTILRNRPIEESASLLAGIDIQSEESDNLLDEVKTDG